jgi:hypothetical protein
MAYGIVKVDNITFDNGGSDQNVTVSGLYRATTSGVTVSGTIAAGTVSGVTVIGSTTVSGATVTGTTANFTSGNFSNIISSAATMSGALIMASQQQVRFRELDNTNHIALQAPEIVSADQTITLPDQTGTVVTTGDNGSVTSTMILDGTILNANISASAAIADTKLATISTAGKVSGTAITSGTIATSSEIGITNTAPIVRLTESDGTATHSQTVIVRDDNKFIIQTRSSTGVFLSSDYAISTDASGANDHSWRIANAEKARLNSAGLTVVNDLIISDKIIHAGDTNTAIRFPAADTVTVETNGVERLRIGGGRLLVGPAASSIPTLGTDGGLQLHNVANASGAQLSIVKFNTDTGAGTLILGKSKSATVAAGAVVANNDFLGTISFVGDDGTDLGSSGAQITCLVDGTPGANDMPGRLTFSTTADGNASPTERMRITSAGLVGIGTSTPTYLLQAAGTIASVNPFGNFAALQAAGGTGFRWTLSNDGTFALQRTTDGFATAQYPIFVDSSSRVGIGTTSPGYALDISSADTTAGLGYAARIRANATAGAGSLQFTDSAVTTQYGFIGFGTNGVGLIQADGASSRLAFATNSTERARIDSSGRLLVGTSTNSAVSTLVLQGNSTSSVGASFLFLQRGVSVPGTNDSLGVLTFGNNASNLGAQILSSRDGGTWTSGTSHPGRLLFFTTADGASTPTERMRITNDGGFMVGQTVTVAPGYGNGTVGAGFSNTDKVLYVSSSNPALRLNRNSDGSIVDFRRSGSAGVVGAISVTTTATAYNTSSDYRLKENVVPLDGAIARLNQLPVHRFNFIADPDTVVDGFIAHEAQAVVPECVTGEKDAVDDDGNPVYQGIDQSKLVPLLTAALQEAVAKIESLEARLTSAGL